MAPDFSIRPPRADELEVVAALVNDLARSLYGEDAVTLDEVRKWFTEPLVDRERDFCVAELPDGRLAAFGSLADLAEDHAIMWLRIALHPERGSVRIAEDMLPVLEARARERAVDGSLIHAQCASKDERIASFYAAHGYELVRHFFRMEIVLDGDQPEARWPDGFELRPLDVDRDLRRVYDADDEAFQDHWGAVRIPFEAWRHWMTGANFDPSLWFLAYAGNELAGFSLCQPEQGGDPDYGWVNVLGVRRPWRRRGLALALLLHSFHEFHRRGKKRVGLGVDAENTTGALRLYERAGMRVVRQFDTWQKRP